MSQVAAPAGTGAAELISGSQAQQSKLSKLMPNGVEITPSVMQTPQALSLVSEIMAGNPSFSLLSARDYAAGYISSNASLPAIGIAAPGATLIKVVPKGAGVTPTSGYWMTPQQAQSVAAMSPEQVGQMLGLPAAQAANILKDGVDFYAITVKSGVTAKIFVSDVAPTTQGLAKSAGGAQQVIVPNRGDWTSATQVNSTYVNSVGKN